MPSERFQISAHAQRELFEILAHTKRRFGDLAAKRYDHLLFTSFSEIAANPQLVNSREFLDMRIYHLRHCRKKAAVDGMIVKAPRHFVLYRMRDSGMIEILRILHDEMDLDQQVRDGA